MPTKPIPPRPPEDWVKPDPQMKPSVSPNAVRNLVRDLSATIVCSMASLGLVTMILKMNIDDAGEAALMAFIFFIGAIVCGVLTYKSYCQAIYKYELLDRYLEELGGIHLKKTGERVFVPAGLYKVAELEVIGLISETELLETQGRMPSWAAK